VVANAWLVAALMSGTWLASLPAVQPQHRRRRLGPGLRRGRARLGAAAGRRIGGAYSTTGCGFFAIAAGAPGGIYTLVSPVVMTILLRRVSEVTRLERGMAKRKPEYAA
jgi:hypothetical protein